MTAVLLLVLSAAPLEIRVLERDTPVRVHLEAARITCDGKPLASSVDAEAGAREVRVGEAKCTQVVAEDGVVVTVKETKRKYGGQLRVSLQGGLLRLINVVDVETYLPSQRPMVRSPPPSKRRQSSRVPSRSRARSGTRTRAITCVISRTAKSTGARAPRASRPKPR